VRARRDGGGARGHARRGERDRPGESPQGGAFLGTSSTFKKTDPLFVFGLANPREPRVEAELKIPGFSTYIHRMDERHLLTIGYDAADQGSFAYFTGVLLQIFDVSDPKAPRLAHRHVLGTRGTTSEALTNHLAFNYFPPKSYSRGWRHCSTGCPGACSAKL
jgi:hypothetical protein